MAREEDGVGYSVFGYSPLLVNYTPLAPLPDLPYGAPHPFLFVTDSTPIDFYIALGDFKQQLVFSSDDAAINNRGDILMRASTLPSEDASRTALHDRQGYFGFLLTFRGII